MPRGGKREGAGRKAGEPNKRTKELQAAVEASGETPLAYMLRVMRDSDTDAQRRDDMAKAAAPFVHAKLAAIEHSGDMTMRHEDALEQLDDEGTRDTAQAPGQPGTLRGQVPQDQDKGRLN